MVPYSPPVRQGGWPTLAREGRPMALEAAHDSSSVDDVALRVASRISLASGTIMIRSAAP